MIPLRVLIVEDSDDDVQLLLRQMRKGGYVPEYKQVEDEPGMLDALGSEWDIVIADNNMPRYNAHSALALLKEQKKDIPFIIVSGTINDKDAVRAMDMGARDYILKDNLSRLLPVIQREIVVAADRSTLRNTAEKLKQSAELDQLTGLPNREIFEKAIDEAIQDSKEHHSEHALLYMDLDQFKVINDTCGHVAGDNLIRQLANEMETQLRKGDILARIGGDDFGMLIFDCNLGTAREIAERFRGVISAYRFSWDNNRFDIGVSIGLVMINDHTSSANEVLSAADVSCYTAKDLGRNRIHVYESGDYQVEQRHGEMMWVSKLTSALDENRLTLFGQNICDIHQANEPRVAQEVLVRMRDKESVNILPGSFIPAAERYNVMPMVDRWVIKTLFERFGDECRSFARNPGENKYHRFFINLSGSTINDRDFLEFVKQQFVYYDIPPQSICFEITETAAVGQFSQAIHLISELRRLGSAFALDDFGSGLSSFSYLKNLPVDYLKIDGAFIRDINTQEVDLAIVDAVCRVCKVMGLYTIGEFIESEDILNTVRFIGVNLGQGYALNKPSALEP